MPYGTLTVEGAVLTESFDITESGTTLGVSGQESTPPQSLATVLQLHANIVGLEGRTVPVLFSQKAERNGFYMISGAKADLFEWANGAVSTCTWSLDMVRVGSGADVEFESRVPTIARLSELTGAPVLPWHAPAGPTALSYYTGTTVPTQVNRVGLDGTLAAFTGLPAGVSPRWTIGLADYMKNACDLYLSGLYAVGVLTPNGVTSWSFDNGLVRVESAGTGVNVSVWRAGSGWSTPKLYTFRPAFAGTPELTVLRNDPEEVVVRLTGPSAPGRSQVDIGLRRGSRFATVQVSRHAAATLGVVLGNAEAGTSQTVGTASQAGGIKATAADGQGVAYVIGSSRVVTVDGTQGGITKASATRFDAFIGAEVGTAQVGDRFADLHAQYLGTNSERTRVVLR